MFGLEKLFGKGKNITESVFEHLKAFKNANFPLGIEASWVQRCDVTKSTITLSIAIPYASNIKAQLQTYLEDALGLTIDLTLSTRLPEQYRFKKIKHIILVASGKGGVGKSTTAINLAYALAHGKGRVGVLDADIYGPSLPSLIGYEGVQPTAKDDKTLNPLEKDSLKCMSIGFLVNPEDATVWRGPMASQALTQLLNETDWGELDYLIVDMPPGTGDIQLTMTQKVPASGAVVITTPQDLALADAQKGISMFEKVNLPILGLIENMSYFNCTHCGDKNYIFGQAGGEHLAHRHGVPLIGEIPLDMSIRTTSEKGGNPIIEGVQPAHHYIECADLIASSLYYQTLSAQTVEIIMTDD